MANPLGEDLRGKVVMVDPIHQDMPPRPFRVLDEVAGRGAEPDTIGSVIFGRYLDMPGAPIGAVDASRVLRLADDDDMSVL